MSLFFRLLLIITIVAFSTSVTVGQDQDISKMSRAELREFAERLQKLNNDYNSKILGLLETEAILKQNISALRTDNSVHLENIAILNNLISNQQKELQTVTAELNKLKGEVGRHRALTDSLLNASVALKAQYQALMESSSITSEALRTQYQALRDSINTGESTAAVPSKPDFLNAYVTNPIRLNNNAFEFRLEKVLYGNVTEVEGYFGESRQESRMLSGLPELFNVNEIDAFESSGMFTMTSNNNWLKDGLKKVNLNDRLKSRLPTFHILQNKFVVFRGSDNSETAYLFEYGPLKYGRYSSSRDQQTSNNAFLFTSQSNGQDLIYNLIFFQGEAYVAMRYNELPIDLFSKEVEIRPIFTNNETWNCGRSQSWGTGCNEKLNLNQAFDPRVISLNGILRRQVISRGVNENRTFQVQLNAGNGFFMVRKAKGLQETEWLNPDNAIFLFKLREIPVSN